MKFTFSKIAVICLVSAISVIILTFGMAAMGNMAGGAGNNAGNNAGVSPNVGVDSGAGSGTVRDRAGIDSGTGADTTMYDGNIDSGTDGHIDDNGSGTGEFADDYGSNPIGRAAGDMVRGAEDAVDTVTGGMGIWGVIIAVVIIAAILALVFAFFRRR